MAKVSDQEIINALEQCKGNQSLAAECLGISRVQINDRRKISKKVDEACIKRQKRIFDKAEDKLEEAVEAGKPWAVTLALTRLGKDEGYSERTEVTGADSGPVEIIIKRES